jgi:Zn-dependent protease
MFNLDLAILVNRALVLLIAFTVHELAHALTADYFGDTTPRMSGRITLNPLAHLDPMGTLLLLVVGFGWAKPVPINPYALNRRSPAAVMWVSLAGPMSNFLMALVAVIPFRLGVASISDAYQEMAGGVPPAPSFPEFLLTFISINLVLMLFNLIPLAPLDGDKIFGLLPTFDLPCLADNPSIWAANFNGVGFVGPMLGFDVLGWVIAVLSRRCCRFSWDEVPRPVYRLRQFIAALGVSGCGGFTRLQAGSPRRKWHCSPGSTRTVQHRGF